MAGLPAVRVHASDISRCRRQRHRLQISAGDRRPAHHGGLRPVLGFKELRQRNWEPLPISPRNIDVVVLTHAHLDHTGYLPLLVRNGFAGKIICTTGTRDLCGILLPDSGRLQEQDADFANRHGFSRHKPALPLYTEADAQKALIQFDGGAYNAPRDLGGGVSATFRNAGHILGASTIAIAAEGRTILFWAISAAIAMVEAPRIWPALRNVALRRPDRASCKRRHRTGWAFCCIRFGIEGKRRLVAGEAMAAGDSACCFLQPARIRRRMPHKSRAAVVQMILPANPLRTSNGRWPVWSRWAWVSTTTSILRGGDRSRCQLRWRSSLKPLEQAAIHHDAPAARSPADIWSRWRCRRHRGCRCMHPHCRKAGHCFATVRQRAAYARARYRKCATAEDVAKEHLGSYQLPR